MPVELIWRICSHLDRRTDNTCGKNGHRDFSSLSRTCRYFRAAVQPLLFTFFDCESPSRPQLIRLLRALELRPDLAQGLKHFKVTFSQKISHTDLDPSDLKYVESQLRELGLPADLPYWYGNPRYFDEPPSSLFLIELILLRTHNLTFLSLPLDQHWMLPVFRECITASSAPLFPRLRTLQITAIANPNTVPLERVVKICSAAPSLRELWTFAPGLRNAKHFTGRFMADQPFANIRRIEFEGYPRVEVLKSMLTGAPHLEVAGLSLAEFVDEEAELWEAFECCKETLRELRINRGANAVQMWPYQVDMKGYLLSNFEKLEVLKVGKLPLTTLRAAFGWDNPRGDEDGFLEEMLPSGIRELTLWEPGQDLLSAVKRLVTSVALGRYPDLRRMVVAPAEVPVSATSAEDWLRDDQLVWKKAEDELRKASEKVGARFEVWDAQVAPTEPSAIARCPFFL